MSSLLSAVIFAMNAVAIDKAKFVTRDNQEERKNKCKALSDCKADFDALIQSYVKTEETPDTPGQFMCPDYPSSYL
jgi:hypothetical protein